MKLKFVAPLLFSLVAAPAFAHGDHDDHGPVVKPGKEVRKDAPAPKAPAEGEAASAKDAQPTETVPAAPKAP
jgi:hypothetical protein